MLAEIGPLTFVCRRWGGSPRRPRMRLRYGTSGYSILERRRRKTSRGLARPVRESPMENSERSVHALRPEARALKWCTVPDCALVLCTRPPRDDTTACIRRFYRKIRDRKIRAGQKDSYRTGRFLPEEVSRWWKTVVLPVPATEKVRTLLTNRVAGVVSAVDGGHRTRGARLAEPGCTPWRRLLSPRQVRSRLDSSSSRPDNAPPWTSSGASHSP